MTNAKFRIKNGLEILETTGSAGTLTLVDGEIDSSQALLLDVVGNITLDAEGDIILDAGGNEVFLTKNATNYGQFANSSDALVMRALVSDGDIIFKGNDGGVVTTLLTLDTANAGAATFNKGITIGGNITGPADVDTSIVPDAGHYIDIDGLFKVTPSITAHVDLDSTAQGSDANNLTGDANNFINFPESGQVYVEGTTAGENPYTYTGKNADSSTLTGLTGLDSLGALSNAMVTLAPKNTTIAGQRYATGHVGQFAADGGQVTIDGGKWGNAASTWAVGVNYGAVILNEATSVMKIATADLASATTYRDTIHMEVIPHVKIGSETPNTLTTSTDYFTGYFKTEANTNAVVNEKLFYNQIIHVDTLAMMKIKSSVQNTESNYNDALGAAMVLETASHGEMNQMLFNFDNVNGQRYLNTGSGTLGGSNYAYSVGGVYKASGAASGATNAGNFGMGYMNRSFNQVGTSLASGPFTGGSSTYGAQGNPLATENTFFQANSSGLVGIGPAQEPAAFATIHVGATGATNVGGVITMDSGSADPSTTANTMYNKGGNLYWGTSNLSAASASALGDLSDVTFGSSTLTVTGLNAFVFANDADNSISVAATTGTTAGRSMTISAGSTATASNNVNGGDLVLASGGGDGTGTSSIQFKTKVSGTDAAAERMRIHTDGNVGIGEAAPGTLLQLSGANAYLTLQNTTGEHGEGGAETKIIFEDHANASLGQIEASHSGTSDDTKGKMILSTHNGTALTAALTISDAQLATFAGDVGVTGDVTISGNDLTFGNNATIVNTDAGTLTITEATTIFSGDIRVNGNEVKDSGGNSALTFDGSGGVTILGNLTVSGDTVQQDVATVTVEDPLMQLARSNSGDSLDIGFYAKYVASGTKYTGLFRDASDGDTYKLFATTGNSHAEPTTTVNTTSGFTLADLDVGVLDSTTLSINTSGTQDAIITSGSVAIANILDTAGATDIDTFTCTTYQATKYIILVEDVTNANYMTTEILLLGDENGGSDAEPYLTQYAVVFNDHELGVFAATGSGNTVTLTYDPTDDGVSGDDNHKVRVVAQRIASI